MKKTILYILISFAISLSNCKTITNTTNKTTTTSQSTAIADSEPSLEEFLKKWEFILFDPAKEGIFYYSHEILKPELNLVMKAIDAYLQADPPYTAEIYVVEDDPKKGRFTKNLLADRIQAMGWTKKDFTLKVDTPSRIKNHYCRNCRF